MSEEQLKAFIAKAKDDQSIQDKLKAAKSPEEVVAIAKENGHEFTADKIAKLSDAELEGVAGGVTTGCECMCGTLWIKRWTLKLSEDPTSVVDPTHSKHLQ